MKTFRTFTAENRIPLIVSGLTFLLIYGSSFNSAYGYFIDEFYYIACANHPALGYVDHPPLAPLILTVFQFVFGSSVYAIRFLPALAQAASVFMTGRVTREMGGGSIAQLVACSTLAASPMFIAFGGFYSMNAFEPLLALVLLWYTIRMIHENDPKQWVPMGIAMGLGMLNKHTFALFIVWLIVALLIDGKWRFIFNRWFVVGGVVGLLIFLPNVIWQFANDFPSLEFYRNISTSKNVYTPPLGFIAGQIMGMSPMTVPIWLAGTLYLLLAKRVRPYRFLAVLFIGLFAFLVVSGTSRGDRLIFGYPPVIAGGGIAVAALIEHLRARWLVPVVILLLAAGLAIGIPLILPYFDYDTVKEQVARLGFNTELERGNKPPLPQLLADRIGWKEKADLVQRAYESLPDSTRKEVMIAAGNYGQAGALELYGKGRCDAPVVCPHNTYYLWSRDRLNGSILLQLSHENDADGLRHLFDSVEMMPGEFSSPYVTGHENHLVVFLCRGAKIAPREMLERSRFYY